MKQRWEKATVTATLFCVAMAANIAVNVVPMFAPMVYGKICLTEIRPAPASGMIREVVTELLWTKAVIRIPKMKPNTSFRKRYLSIITSILVSIIDLIVLIRNASAENMMIREKMIMTRFL